MDMREKIKEVASDMLQNVNVRCNYVFVQNGKDEYAKNMKAIDAYMKAYEMTKNGDVECYMAALGENNKATRPVFTVIGGIVTLSGQIVN